MSNKINMAKKTSYIWQHYKIIDQFNARCNVCNKRLSYKTSISNLKKHMNLKHPGVGLEDPSNYIYPTTPTQDDDDDNMDDRDHQFPADAEDVKTLLGLSSGQVSKNIEIIEEVNNGTHVIYNEDASERVTKTRAKPSLKKCLKAIERKIKKEPTSSSMDELPVLRNRDDTVDVLIQNIGNKLRKMPEKQQIIAEYKIHEILFMGLSNQLKNPGEDHNSHNSHHNINYSMSAMNPGDSINDSVGNRMNMNDGVGNRMNMNDGVGNRMNMADSVGNRMNMNDGV